jgi:histidinol-phosphatase (PHP family)
MVLSAIEKGFNSIGFSGHGYTPFEEFCIQDTQGYIAEVKRLKEKYKDKIQIYLGVEEEMFHFVNREDYDYIIGSSHYFGVGEQKISIDYSYDLLHSTLKYYGGDPLALAEDYYKKFCEYILNRKPDIVGHFDLITKFDEKNAPLFFGNQKYYDLAEKYLLKAIQSQCIFEVNTGAIARGYRTTPYPDQRLLSVLKKQGAKVVLSSDSHNASTIDCGLKEARLLLKDVGFDCVYALYDGKFIKDYL